MLINRIGTIPSAQEGEYSKTENLLARANGRKIVTIFGSSRLTPDSPAFQDAEKAAGLLARCGYAVLTGGGPGIMAAANQGAYQAGGISLAACIQLPLEERPNPYVTASATYETFSPRKNCLMKNAAAFLVYPGGYGTCDELFEILTLQATGKQPRTPIILVGRDYWKELSYWLNTMVMRETQCISPKELGLFHIVPNAEDAVRYLRKNVSAPDKPYRPIAEVEHDPWLSDRRELSESVC